MMDGGSNWNPGNWDGDTWQRAGLAVGTGGISEGWRAAYNAVKPDVAPPEAPNSSTAPTAAEIAAQTAPIENLRRQRAAALALGGRSGTIGVGYTYGSTVGSGTGKSKIGD